MTKSLTPSSCCWPRWPPSPRTAPAPAGLAATPRRGFPAPADDALFRDLGGQPGIDAIVGDFVPRLVADRAPASSSRRPTRRTWRRCWRSSSAWSPAAAAPTRACRWTRPTTTWTSSKGDFNALVEVLQASMDAQHVPFSTQNRLLARLAPMHREIVNVH